MIITINQQKLKEGLTVTEKIISRNLSLPILQNIVIKTESGRVKIYSTNLEMGVNCWLGAKIEEEGEIAIPARIFADFINNMASEQVTIITKENIVSINADNFKTKIIGFSTKDFPLIPKSKNTSFVSLEARQLYLLISAVLESASLSETRPELAGVFIHFSPARVESAATDSFRLAEQVVFSAEVKNEQSVILPKTTAQEMIRVLSPRSGPVTVAISENQIFFTAGDVEVVSRLIDGHYPDYKRVFPEKIAARLTLSRTELEKSVRLASIFTSQMADIKIQSFKEGLKILAKNTDKGEVDLTVKGALKGDPFKITVNYRYLLDGLKNISTEKLVMEFTGEDSPLMLKPEGQNDFTYLIMPLRS